jgi:hypothetical protein
LTENSQFDAKMQYLHYSHRIKIDHFTTIHRNCSGKFCYKKQKVQTIDASLIKQTKIRADKTFFVGPNK